MPNAHIYSPLPQKAIRLLRFISDAEDKDLECELVVFLLDSAPQYNALSYCWGGDFNRSASIRCNRREMMITSILLEALQDLIVLHRGGVEWIWIDQVCINQADVLERGRQVDMMRAIYQTSEGTIIWLGTKIPGIESVKPLLEKLSHLYHRDLDPGGTRKRRRYTMDEYKAIDLPHPEDLSWSILGDIFSRPWFVRAWVIQEAALSKVTPQVLCGTHKLSWELILTSGTWLESMCYKSSPLNLRPTTVVALRSIKLFGEIRHVGLPWDMTTLLNKTRRFKSSEPRDRVYSLIGLTREVDESSALSAALQANYDKPVRDVFRDLTLYIIMSSGSLRILSLIRSIPDWNKYPSWVIDFTSDVLWDRISYFTWSTNIKGCHSIKETSNHAAGGLPVDVQNSSGDILALKGFRVDSINALCAVMSGSSLNSFGPEALEVLREAQRRLKYRYTSIEAIARAIMVTLTANWNLTNQERVADLPIDYFWACMKEAYHRLHDKALSNEDKGKLEEDYGSLLAEGMADVAVEANIYRLHLDAADCRRVFFTETKAYVGLGPSNSQENDILCILFGGATPMILRPFGDFYRFVGECYVYDLMSGEAIQDWQKGGYITETFHLI